jgi:hypothetical protein
MGEVRRSSSIAITPDMGAKVFSKTILDCCWYCHLCSHLSIITKSLLIYKSSTDFKSWWLTDIICFFDGNTVPSGSMNGISLRIASLGIHEMMWMLK